MCRSSSPRVGFKGAATSSAPGLGLPYPSAPLKSRHVGTWRSSKRGAAWTCTPLSCRPKGRWSELLQRRCVHDLSLFTSKYQNRALPRTGKASTRFKNLFGCRRRHVFSTQAMVTSLARGEGSATRVWYLGLGISLFSSCLTSPVCLGLCAPLEMSNTRVSEDCHRT